MAEKKEKKKGSEFDELSLDEMIEKKKQIDALLADLENQYRGASITEQSYKQTKESNLKKLIEVKKRLEEWGITDTGTAPAPATGTGAPNPSPSAAVPKPSPNVVSETLKEPAQDKSSAAMPASATPSAEPAKETPAAQSTPAQASLSFAQKLKQFAQPSGAPKSAEDMGYQSISQIQSVVSQTAQLEMQKFQEKFNVELERLKATLDAMKETRASSDERIHMLTEGLAELRSNVFQREAGIKEQEMKIAKLKELMEDIEPQKISKEFTKRDKTFSDIEVRTEKLEIKVSDLIKSLGEINSLLKSIGGLENVANIDHEVAKKLEKVEEINKSAERLSSRIEKIFIDMNKRLEKFNIYEARQDNMNEIVNDLMKNLDGIGIKFEGYVEKKELTTFKEDLADMQKKLEEMKKTLKKAVPFAEAQVPEEVQALMNEKEDVETLLSSVEYEHQRKQISDADYNSIKEKNMARLKEIREKIGALVKSIEPAEPKETSKEEKKEAPAIKDNAGKEAKPLEKPSEVEQKVAAPKEDVPKPETTQATAPAKAAASKTEEVTQNANSPEAKLDSTTPQQAATSTDVKKPETDNLVKTEQKTKTGKAKKNAPPAVQKDNVSEKQSETIEKPKETIEKPNNESTPEDNPLLAELEESLKQGLINKETYENTKKLLLMG